MRLKSIKLAGFKSFCDATVLPVEANLVGIVGPNGCGKSNVIDAVRWVIGETSAKQLRGQSMSDVIFNGTTNRQPVGKAAVELFFDECEGYLTGEYAKYAQIAIRREVTREGQSTYFFNGTVCRRKDIVDIFLGTGLGPRSYAIIEQGMISRLIEAKPEELRVFLEEAAGISKYKERRRETENRIRHTKENLSRVNDLCEELAKQLSHLQKQAAAAERYQVLKDEELQLELQIKALQWQGLNAQLEHLNKQLQEQENIKGEVQSKQQTVETDIEKSRLAQVEAQDRKNDVQKQFYALGADIARIEQRIKHAEEQAHQWELELEQADALKTELVEALGSNDETIVRLDAEIARLTPEVSNADSIRGEAEALLASAEDEMATWQSTWETFQETVSQSSQRLEVNKTNMAHYREQIDSLEARNVLLREKREGIDAERVMQDIQPVSLRVDQLQAEMDHLRQSIQGQVERIHLQRMKNQQVDEQLQALRSRFNQSEGKQASLKALQADAMKHQAQVNDWLRDNALENNTKLIQDLAVENGWEKAVETVLSEKIDAIYVDNIADIADKIATLTDARITIVDRQTQVHAHNSVLHLDVLVDKIQSGHKDLSLFADVYVANHVDVALSKRAMLKNHESIITRDGVWVGKDWVRIAVSQNAEEGVIQREKVLTQLQATLDDLTAQIREQEGLLQDGKEQLLTLEGAREDTQAKLNTLNSDYTDAFGQLNTLNAKLDESRAQMTHYDETVAENEQKIADLKAQLVEAESSWEATSTLKAQHDADRSRLTAERETLQAALNAARESAVQKRQHAEQVQLQIQSNENQLALLRQTRERERKQLEQLNVKVDALQSSLSENAGPDEGLQQNLQTLLQSRAAVEVTLRDAEQALQSVNDRLGLLDEERNKLSQDLMAMQSQMQTIQVNRQTVVVNQDNIVSVVAERETTIEAVVETFPEDIALEAWENRLLSVVRRITRLGPINLAAIDECQTLEARKGYLDEQQADLNEALEALEGAIRKIDRETRSRFKETFDAVNEGFQQIFPRVFGGGKACIELMEEDLLTAGVQVKAQPPGKKNASIHMLSGGEKALTAISLVFALFQLNPAPFCILDEVDAPLDDANVGRYCNLVAEMSDRTQFLVISHNKITIERSEQLLGVTMQEAGVSRLVSVDVDKAVALAE